MDAPPQLRPRRHAHRAHRQPAHGRRPPYRHARFRPERRVRQKDRKQVGERFSAHGLCGYRNHRDQRRARTSAARPDAAHHHPLQAGRGQHRGHGRQ